ncbi:YciI family protein [Arthrobacter monumenti]
MSVFVVEYVYEAETAAARNELLPTHRQWLKEHTESGRVLSSGPYVDGAGALLLFTADSEPALLEELKQDPFNQAGLVSGMRVKEWKPLLGAFTEHA